MHAYNTKYINQNLVTASTLFKSQQKKKIDDENEME